MPHFVQTYGDLIFDLSDSLLQDPKRTQSACRAILKQVNLQRRLENYIVYERAWILQITCQQLLVHYAQSRSLSSLEDQAQSDSSESAQIRLQSLPLYLSRLKPEEQMVLLLKEKHEISFEDIAMGLSIPPSSLKLKRDQSLRTLECWLSSPSEHILSTLYQLPKKKIPKPLADASLSFSVPTWEGFRNSLLQIGKMPWYIRIFIEAAGMVSLVLVAISSAPKVRDLYEKHWGGRFSGLQEDIDSAGLAGDDLLPASSNGTEVAENAPGIAIDSTLPDGEDISGENEEEDLGPAGSQHSDLWRFTLKTVSPDELRPLVTRILQELKLSPLVGAMQGTRVPGGIEFDLLVPKTVVPELQVALEKLIPASTPQPETPAGTEKPFRPKDFSWYRVPSKRRIPEGKAKVVIWLSQPVL